MSDLQAPETKTKAAITMSPRLSDKQQIFVNEPAYGITYAEAVSTKVRLPHLSFPKNKEKVFKGTVGQKMVIHFRLVDHDGDIAKRSISLESDPVSKAIEIVSLSKTRLVIRPLKPGAHFLSLSAICQHAKIHAGLTITVPWPAPAVVWPDTLEQGCAKVGLRRSMSLKPQYLAQPGDVLKYGIVPNHHQSSLVAFATVDHDGVLSLVGMNPGERQVQLQVTGYGGSTIVDLPVKVPEDPVVNLDPEPSVSRPTIGKIAVACV